MNLDFAKIRQRYDDTLTKDVIPFWENHAIDKQYGGYFTSLDRDGSVYDTTKYMWMQWRIVYMFAAFYSSRYSQPQFLEIAKQGYDFLTKHGKAEDGSYYFALNQQGEPVIAPYNVFSDCFAAMGAAELYRATKEQPYADEANSAMCNYLRRVNSGNPAGRWNKAMPAKTAYQSFGMFMMIANLALVMKNCLGNDEYQADADRTVDLVLEKFWNPELKLMFENVCEDGTFDLESCQGRMLNPGHTLEAMGFLLNYLRQAGRTEHNEKILAIVKRTLEFGWDQKYDGIFYFMDALGKPHLELQADMKLWWVHNEAATTALLSYVISKDETFLQWFDKLDKYSFSHFADPQYGEWFGYLNRQGEPTHLLKGGKWKTFFHLPRYLMSVSDLLGELV
ncbi:MAG: AGE family epimerase/isomerase [Victivallales bacterium]|nr:AGE family epimerase/isomerase [Victivallales bacterium]